MLFMFRGNIFLVKCKAEKCLKVNSELCIWSRSSSRQPPGSNRPHPEQPGMAEGSSLREASNDVILLESVFAHFLAVQDSSISDIVSLSVPGSEPTNNQSLGSIKE